jgi:hypothetical protein
MTRRHRFAFLSVPPSSLPAVARERRLPGSRLQGFAPCRSPLSARWGLATATARSLLEFSLLQVLLSLLSPQSLTPASAHRLIARPSGRPSHRRTAC